MCRVVMVAVMLAFAASVTSGGWLLPDSAGQQVRVEIVEQTANQTVCDLLGLSEMAELGRDFRGREA
jgi:hypothetical protein